MAKAEVKPQQPKLTERRYTTKSGAVYVCISSGGVGDSWTREYEGKELDLNEAIYVSSARAQELLAIGKGRNNSQLLDLIKKAKKEVSFTELGGKIVSLHEQTKLRASYPIEKITPPLNGEVIPVE